MNSYVRGGTVVNMRPAASPAPTALPAAAHATGFAPQLPYWSGSYAGTRPGTQTQSVQQPRAPAPVTTDDYERWYTEGTHSNRMVLSLRSGIDSEIAWSLHRLSRLAMNDTFNLSSIPGLADALFEWPERYVEEYALPGQLDAAFHLFSLPPSVRRHHRYAMESLSILRNTSFLEVNAAILTSMPRARTLVLEALDKLSPLVNVSDECAEFVLLSTEILISITRSITIPAPDTNAGISNPIPALEKLASESSDRSQMITSLTALTHLLSIPKYAIHNSATSPALTTAIRNLTLYTDSSLVDTCVSFLYAHLSHSPMTKAFLHHPDMPGTLRVLVGYIKETQPEMDNVLDISGPRHVAPIVKTKVIDVVLAGEELEKIASTPEPERCYAWMRAMFKANSDSEVTQVEFWTSYKETFNPFASKHALLVASDVIKNVGSVYPQAQAMVLPGPPQRFVIRGIGKAQREVAEPFFKCQWSRGTCGNENCTTPTELYEHLKTHLEPLGDQDETNAVANEFSCSWSTCQHSAESLNTLRPHVWTHIPLSSSIPKDPQTIPKAMFATASEQHVTATPTERTAPPAPRTQIKYLKVFKDPPSTALTALLIIRTLFRASFTSVEEAPRADADHFGFPGAVDEGEDGLQAQNESDNESEREGMRRGRKAFVGVRNLMNSVRIMDPTLMSWITEMVDATAFDSS